MNIETLAIHAGQAVDPQTGAVIDADLSNLDLCPEKSRAGSLHVFAGGQPNPQGVGGVFGGT